MVVQLRGVVVEDQASGPREGAIIHEIITDATGAPQLRFYCYTGLRGEVRGGAEEQAEQAAMDTAEGFEKAVRSTLKRTRELLA